MSTNNPEESVGQILPEVVAALGNHALLDSAREDSTQRAMDADTVNALQYLRVLNERHAELTAIQRAEGQLGSESQAELDTIEAALRQMSHDNVIRRKQPDGTYKPLA